MDLVGEMLIAQWRSMPARVRAEGISLRIPRVARRLTGPTKGGLNFDRALVRYLAYPLRVAIERRPDRIFHVADHSYAQTVHVLPASRTGVYCHDLDAFSPLLAEAPEQRRRSAPWREVLAWGLLRGLKSAAVVFHSTRDVADGLERRGLVAKSRLVHAPYGVSAEFHPADDPNDGADPLLSPLRGRPFLLHVGSSAPRKRLDVLFEVFARLRQARPELCLVQQGAQLSSLQSVHIQRLGIQAALIQPPKLSRSTLAGLYRRATAVMVTSEAEGFGFPVLEALACGSPVVASDIRPLREVGGDAARYAPPGDVVAWYHLVRDILDGKTPMPPKEVRIARAAKFTWEGHAHTILTAYREIARIGGNGARTPPISRG
jgi:glycosyltransferase involved in cell wall biosynthesis